MNKEIWRRRSIEANIRNQIVNFFDDSKDEQEHESEVCNSDSSDEEKKKDRHLKGHSISNLNMNDDNIGVARHIEHSSNNNIQDDWSSEGNNVLNSSDEDVEVIKKNMNNFLNDNIRIERVNFGMKPMNVLTFEMKKSKRQLQYFSEKFNSLLDELIMRVKVLEDHHVYCVSKINDNMPYVYGDHFPTLKKLESKCIEDVELIKCIRGLTDFISSLDIEVFI